MFLTRTQSAVNMEWLPFRNSIWLVIYMTGAFSGVFSFACLEGLQQRLLFCSWVKGLRHLLCHFWFNLITWPHLGKSDYGNLKV